MKMISKFAMYDNSAATWHNASNEARQNWLLANNFCFTPCDLKWDGVPGNIQQAFVNWYRANHNV